MPRNDNSILIYSITSILIYAITWHFIVRTGNSAFSLSRSTYERKEGLVWFAKEGCCVVWALIGCKRKGKELKVNAMAYFVATA
ncbi:hypothetical protein OIU77_002737 [Salix suchowensis]|uniref:Uncharacterized protein n=1 Tax=Salix suchowensis TaxID=1278906 RepID=A0ABQ9AYX0_9ROSI|nr:hypothetical protein OIU77_002737 [Salix suchowensis]